MTIGIDASRAFIRNRTGIEEYSYHVIKNLIDALESHQVVLYARKNQKIDFDLPKNWIVKVLKWPYVWTQVGLSLELLLHPVDVLFVPAHTVPLIHPKNTIVTIHGLEYEFCPKAYSLFERLYMRFSIKNSCRWAKKIIAVSENTKNDLVNLYKVSFEKVRVIYEGVTENLKLKVQSSQIGSERYLLFIGRIEERKNVCGIIEAFEILKNKYEVPCTLVLAGKPGYGHEKIKIKIQSSKFKGKIILKGFISEQEKGELLKTADVFLFPSFYEGFGLPILEAQMVGVPVVASKEASIPEVVGNGGILIDPGKPEEIAKAVYTVISDENVRNDIIKRGLENVKRFSWEKCAQSIAKFITEK